VKILVVDDERDVEALFRQKFRREIRAGRLEFVFAFSGEEAIEVLGGSGAEIVLILSDINMPGMSGLELLSQLRERRLGHRIYMVTAYGDQSTRETALQLGADDFLTKPLDFEELRGRLEKL
jgi:CheY-like chemotaxis protein